LAKAAEQFSQVLYRGNEQILGSLFPESTPTGPLKTMAISGIGKAAFDQVLAPSQILSSCFGVGDFASSIQQFLISMPVDGGGLPGALTRANDLAQKLTKPGFSETHSKGFRSLYQHHFRID
jgi:hypothetical protein